jgi:hypothetical protein
MNYAKYCGAAQKEDSATLKLIDGLCGVLKGQFGDDVITLFRRSKPTPPSGRPLFEAERRWEEHLCFIDGKIEQLKAIISKLLYEFTRAASITGGAARNPFLINHCKQKPFSPDLLLWTTIEETPPK